MPLTDKEAEEIGRQRLGDQLIKLGDMMGDGLHHEADGKWIEKEYKRTFNLLYPEYAKKRRKQTAININVQIDKLLLTARCSKCQSTLRQSRSGSKILYCNNTQCNARFTATSKPPKQ